VFEKEMNNYWKTVVDTIQDGVMIVDKGGTIVSVTLISSPMRPGPTRR
jgi:two-component system response regulator HydG